MFTILLLLEKVFFSFNPYKVPQRTYHLRIILTKTRNTRLKGLNKLVVRQILVGGHKSLITYKILNFTFPTSLSRGITFFLLLFWLKKRAFGLKSQLRYYIPRSGDPKHCILVRGDPYLEKSPLSFSWYLVFGIWYRFSHTAEASFEVIRALFMAALLAFYFGYFSFNTPRSCPSLA